MKFNTEKPRPLCPAGDHILKLVEVREQEMDDRYGKSATGKVVRNIWQFVSSETDEDGTPYEYGVFTGDTYGNPKAGMTLLVDMLVPGMTVEKFADFDSDELIGKKFRAQIKHVKREDGTGAKAVHVYITPVGNKATPQVKPDTYKPLIDTDTDDLSDPFRDS